MSADPTTGYGAGSPPGRDARGARDSEDRRRLADLRARRRQLEQQTTVFQRFLDRLAEQVRLATEQGRPPEYQREVLQRRLSVQARLEEVRIRVGFLDTEEEQLTASVARSEAGPPPDRAGQPGPSDPWGRPGRPGPPGPRR